ncbi:hypothetical protein [Bacillus massilinigeriensis]|uniref:hypothetical protein n=1 Tax=Bacillus mediterraneensis TaxID=1805474 RepID=UPI0008F8ABB0|nr:hypothetical protein [Bacillus mediterraneensis]
MEGVIVYHSYGFIGFSLCKQLLENGVEVLGIHDSGKSSAEIEVKNMEIGRNANFSEWGDGLSPAIMETRYSRMIVPLLDLYMEEWGEEIDISSVFRTNEIQLSEDFRVSFIVPRRWLFQPEEMVPVFRHLLAFLEQNSIGYQKIFTPTLYGPWQSEEYCFQQLIKGVELGIDRIPSLGKREDTEDALYIDDAVPYLIALIKLGKGEYLLQSGNPDSWYQCYNVILSLSGCKSPQTDFCGEIGDSRNSPRHLRGIKRITVKEEGDLKEKIASQTRHYARIRSFLGKE